MKHSRVVRGLTVPSFFYGTAWKEERTRTLTELALAAGFAAIDTANQRNQKPSSTAISDKLVHTPALHGNWWEAISERVSAAQNS